MSELGAIPFAELLERVAAKTPTPGGGAVACAVGALGAALAEMVVAFSIGKKGLATYEPLLRGAAIRLARARELLLALADEDAEAYATVNRLQRLPEDHPERQAELDEAVRASIQVPMSTIGVCVDLLRLFVDLSSTTNKNLRSDLAIAAVLADATARASRWNVLVNAASGADPESRQATARSLNELLADSTRLAAKVEQACQA